MKIKTTDDQQILQEALMILMNHLEPTKFRRFIAKYNLGQGNYLQFKDKEFANETVATISQKIDAEQKPESINYTHSQYNPEIDELKICWSQAEIQESDSVSPGVILDYDTAGNVIGIGILNASEKIRNFHS